MAKAWSVRVMNRLVLPGCPISCTKAAINAPNNTVSVIEIDRSWSCDNIVPVLKFKNRPKRIEQIVVGVTTQIKNIKVSITLIWAVFEMV